MAGMYRCNNKRFFWVYPTVQTMLYFLILCCRRPQRKNRGGTSSSAWHSWPGRGSVRGTVWADGVINNWCHHLHKIIILKRRENFLYKILISVFLENSFVLQDWIFSKKNIQRREMKSNCLYTFSFLSISWVYYCVYRNLFHPEGHPDVSFFLFFDTSTRSYLFLNRIVSA